MQNFSLISRAVANLVVCKTAHVLLCFPNTDRDTVLGQWLHRVWCQHQQRRAVEDLIPQLRSFHALKPPTPLGSIMRASTYESKPNPHCSLLGPTRLPGIGNGVQLLDVDPSTLHLDTSGLARGFQNPGAVMLLTATDKLSSAPAE